jgi:hypothetical protein
MGGFIQAPDTSPERKRRDSSPSPGASPENTGRKHANSRTAARLTGFGSGTDDRSDKGHGDGQIL